jgi:hypothetical protein
MAHPVPVKRVFLIPVCMVMSVQVADGLSVLLFG